MSNQKPQSQAYTVELNDNANIVRILSVVDTAGRRDAA